MNFTFKKASGRMYCRFLGNGHKRITRGESYIELETDSASGWSRVGICKDCAPNFFKMVSKAINDLDISTSTPAEINSRFKTFNPSGD